MLTRTTHVILGFLTVVMLVLVVGCGNDDDPTGPDNPTAPVVTTSAVTDVTQTAAQSGGNVTSDGGAAVTARGVCWSANPTPTIADSKTTDGSGTGSFTTLCSDGRNVCSTVNSQHLVIENLKLLYRNMQLEKEYAQVEEPAERAAVSAG